MQDILYHHCTIPKEIDFANDADISNKLHHFSGWDKAQWTYQDPNTQSQRDKACLRVLRHLWDWCRQSNAQGKSVACPSERWERLYIGNEILAIKSLQFAGNCWDSHIRLGLSTITMCHEIYKREESCLRSWSESQNLTAVIMIIVVLVPFTIKGFLMAINLCFNWRIFTRFGINNMSILDRKLESGLGIYNLFRQS